MGEGVHWNQTSIAALKRGGVGENATIEKRGTKKREIRWLRQYPLTQKSKKKSDHITQGGGGIKTRKKGGKEKEVGEKIAK